MERTRGGAVRPQTVVTARDVELVAWLARFGYATTPILCRRFGSSYKQMRWRIARLVRLKVLRQERLHRPWIVLPTADGMELAASPLSVPSLSLVRIRHTLGIAQLGCEAELAGSKVWPEREIRVTDRGRRRLTLSVHLPAKHEATRAVWHVPDLVIAHPSPSGGPPLLEAVELELTSKSAGRLHAILTAYAASPLFTRVTYYTCSRSITVAVEDTAAAISLHARELIRVRPYVVPCRDEPPRHIVGYRRSSQADRFQGVMSARVRHYDVTYDGGDDRAYLACPALDVGGWIPVAC